MKSVLASLVLFSNLSMADVTQSYDIVSCKVSGTLSMTIRMRSAGPEVEAKYWNDRGGKWSTAYLATQYASNKLYSVEPLIGSKVAFVEVGGGVRLLDASGAVLSDCKSQGSGGGYGEDYGGMRGDEFIP